jgi:hypothetical protein
MNDTTRELAQRFYFLGLIEFLSELGPGRFSGSENPFELVCLDVCSSASVRHRIAK